jgi:hypothetical protein
MDHTEVAINGKRGEVQLAFNLVEAGEPVGRGRKRLILSGLREYDKQVMDEVVVSLNQRKQAFMPH